MMTRPVPRHDRELWQLRWLIRCGLGLLAVLPLALFAFLTVMTWGRSVLNPAMLMLALALLTVPWAAAVASWQTQFTSLTWSGMAIATGSVLLGAVCFWASFAV